MSYYEYFSQVRCREMAATQRLMMEMPESQCQLITRCATIAACDYDGTIKLHDLVNEIMSRESDYKNKPGPVTRSAKLTGREGRTK